MLTSQQIKPLRSMTHPRQKAPSTEPKKPALKQTVKQTAKHGEPFDPEELSRRLQTYLANQKIRAEQRRNSKATAAKVAVELTVDEHVPLVASKQAASGQENGYHHVPKVAASAFARTATPEPMRQIHRLSQPALKARLDQYILEEPSAAKPLRKTQAMDHAIAEREMLRNRNPFQRSQAMEDAAEVDMYRDPYKPQRRSFRADSLMVPTVDRASQRRLSAGDVLDRVEPQAGSTAKMRRLSRPTLYEMSERSNWAQPEELAEAKSPAKKEETAPPVRRKSSSWILLGKRSPKLEKGKDDASTALIGETTSQTTEGTKKSSFLSRFKRHPT